MKSREALHSGSWYSSNGSKLQSELEGWLSKTSASSGMAKAVIVPHAGYTYCGATAAHAYNEIDGTKYKRVFILGPSHHAHITKCALSICDTYSTPLYDLKIDKRIYEELMATDMFQTMDKLVDEEEHSIEMQLPYIAKIMEKRRDDFTIVPVMVGSLSDSQQNSFAEVFAPYLADPDNLFVISSDFCHWGSRFGFTFYDNSKGDIWQSIEFLDKKGMNYIEELNCKHFTAYLKEYENTICGRIPICILIKTVERLKLTKGIEFDMKFKHYSQSSKCFNNRESSVSYAAGVLTLT